MPLTDLSSCITITSLDIDQGSGGWKFVDDDLQTSDASWDTWTLLVIKDYGSERQTSSLPITAETVSRDWPTGKRVWPGVDFWVRSCKPEQVSPTVWKATLDTVGRIDAARPVKFSIGATDERWRQEVNTGAVTQIGAPYYDPPIFVNLPGSLQQVTAFQRSFSAPVITASYILVGILPQTERVGAAGSAFQTPPLNIPVTPLPGFLSPQVELYLPYGWVMTGMDADILAGTDVPASLVTETWSYIHNRR